MEFLSNLLKIPKLPINSSENLKKTDMIVNDNPLQNIVTQIKNLENLNLSPLPITSMDKNIQFVSMANYIRKIVYSLSLIIQNKCKIDKLSSIDDNEVSYWNYVCKHFSNFKSVKFINLYFEKARKSEKGLAWILLLLLEKKLNDFFNGIYNTELDK
jgi:hypothetical protein